MNIVIADAGPLIALSRIGKLGLLKQLFQQISITNIVRDEILINDHSRGKTLIQKAIKESWIQIEIIDFKDWSPLNSGVDAGESSAIFLACQSPKTSLLIIDDQAGRAEARYHGIAIIGTAAVIGIAKEHGFITSAKAVLAELCEVGYYEYTPPFSILHFPVYTLKE
jgi:predicted nucleic acid-binding protein